MKGKRGLSPVIAVLLLILITVAAVTLVATFLIPFVKDTLNDSTECVDYKSYFTFEENFEDGDKVIAKRLALKAISDSDKAISLSSFNVNLKRDRASMFIKLSVFESPYLILARKTLEEAVSLAPTDAKLFYNLSLSYLRTGDTEKALQILQKTIKMKPDYKNAYYALGLIYIDEKKYGLAREQFEYILEHLDPNDQDVIRELNELLP